MSPKNLIAALTLATLAASPVLTSTTYGFAVAGPTVTVTRGGQTQTVTLSSNTYDGTNFNFVGTGPGFSFSMTGDNDPLIVWGFTATSPGAYVVNFSAPVVGTPYQSLKNQATLTMSDIGAGGNDSFVTGVALNGQDPAFTTVNTLSGDLTDPNGSGAFKDYGNVTTIGTYTGAFFQENVNFTFTSADADSSAAFSGQLLLSKTPEPASLSLIGLTAAPLLLRRKRNA